MKSILMCLFLFILGSLGANTDKLNIPTDVNSDEVQDLSGKLSEKQSFDPALSDSVITKRAVGHQSSDRLYKLNFSPVCFSARNNKYGAVTIPFAGKLAAVKLVHLYGFVTCHKHSPANWSFWGCGGVKGYANVIITTSRNRYGILLPPRQFMKYRYQAGKWYKYPGYNAFSPELVLSRFSNPYPVSSGQQLRVWYGEDLMNWTEGDNDGRVCCDVYGIFV